VDRGGGARGFLSLIGMEVMFGGRTKREKGKKARGFVQNYMRIYNTLLFVSKFH
jgi:hypothetical protein